MSVTRVGQRIVFADGTKYENTSAGYSDGVLVVFMNTAITLHEAPEIFFNPNKTSRIVFEYGDMEDTYDGFTHVTNMREDVDKNVSVTLRKDI